MNKISKIFPFLLIIIVMLSLSSHAQKLEPVLDESSNLYGYKKVGDDKWIIPATYFKAFSFSTNGVAVVREIEGFSLINNKGKKITKTHYDRMGWSNDADTTLAPLFYGNFIGVRIKNKWGVINTKGKEVTIPSFQTLNYFDNGASIVSNNDRYGALNTNGELVIPTTFQKLRPLAGGLPFLVATNDNLEGVVNLEGDWILGLEFISIKWAGKKLIAAMTQKGEWIFVDHDGNRYSDEEYTDWKWYYKENKLLLNQQGRYGLLDEDTKEIYPTIYKEITFTDSSIIAQSYPTLELGTIDGAFYSKWHCDSLSYAGDDLVRYYTSGKVGVANVYGQNKFYDFYDEVGDFIDGQAIVKKRNKFGVCDSLGALIIPVEYTNLKRMPTGHYWTLDIENYPDVFDHKGVNLTMHKYDMVGEYSQGKYLVRRARLYGYLDSDLNEWVAPQYKDAESFVGPYAVVRTSDYYGVIDLDKKWVITPIIDRLMTISEGLFYYEDNQQWGTLDIDGIEWFRTDSATMESFHEGYVVMKKRGNYGLLTSTGKQTLSTLYDSLNLDYLSAGRVEMYLDSTWLYKEVDDFEGEPSRDAYTLYDTTHYPSEGYSIVKMGGKYGFMDYLGRLRLSCRYDNVKDFSEGLAPFALNHKWGFINKEDIIVLQPRYEDLEGLVENAAKAKSRGLWGAIDPSGKEVIPFKYENVERTPYNNWYIWEKGGKMGIYEPGGIKGIYGKYDKIIDLGDSYVKVYRDYMCGIDRIDGYSTWSIKYYSVNLHENRHWVSMEIARPKKIETSL